MDGCFIWELYSHEKNCPSNLNKESEKFVKKCFGQEFYNDDDLFVNGNVVKPFAMKLASSPDQFKDKSFFDLFFKPSSVVSPESVIYLITDDGLKCKIYYKYVKEDFVVRIEHDYDETLYAVTIRTKHESSDFIREINNFKQNDCLALGKCHNNWLFSSDDFTAETPWFVVIIKRILPNNVVTDKA